MKAILRDGDGGVVICDVADAPAPGAGEVRVTMALAPVNPADRMLVAGAYSLAVAHDEIVGAEGVGRVDTVGHEVAGLIPGDRVICLDRGNWTQQRTIAADRVIRVPDALADPLAAVLRINPPTAERMLSKRDLHPGDWVILNGAASMVGRLTVALARERGVRTLCLVRDVSASAPVLSNLGADAIIADDGEVPQRAAAIIGEAGARLALDCVAGEASGRLAACLGHSGLLMVYGNLSGQACAIPSSLLTGRGVKVRGFSLRPDEGRAARAELQPMFARLAQLLADNPAIVPPHTVYPAARIAFALDHPGPGRALIALDRAAWT